MFMVFYEDLVHVFHHKCISYVHEHLSVKHTILSWVFQYCPCMYFEMHTHHSLTPLYTTPSLGQVRVAHTTDVCSRLPSYPGLWMMVWCGCWFDQAWELGFKGRTVMFYLLIFSDHICNWVALVNSILIHPGKLNVCVDNCGM